MAKYLADLYPQLNSVSTSAKFKAPDSLNLAPKFKHRTNCPRKDIEEIRRLLCLERDETNETHKFWAPDYERMMTDDWLVSRFLIRGNKANQKLCDKTNKQSALESHYAQTIDLVRSCAKFRHDFRINGLTREDEFPIEWLKVNGLFSHLPDRSGNPTIYMRIKLHKPKLVESKQMRHRFKRLLLYTLEKCDQDLANNPGKAICCVFDMSDATFENVDLELISWMAKSFKSCSPKLLAYTIVYNLPWFFSATLKLISSKLMSQSNKQSLRFVYGQEILNYIERAHLPDYLRETL